MEFSHIAFLNRRGIDLLCRPINLSYIGGGEYRGFLAPNFQLYHFPEFQQILDAYSTLIGLINRNDSLSDLETVNVFCEGKPYLAFYNFGGEPLNLRERGVITEGMQSLELPAFFLEENECRRLFRTPVPVEPYQIEPLSRLERQALASLLLKIPDRETVDTTLRSRAIEDALRAHEYRGQRVVRGFLEGHYQ
jgi:hypothetical protein